MGFPVVSLQNSVFDLMGTGYLQIVHIVDFLPVLRDKLAFFIS